MPAREIKNWQLLGYYKGRHVLRLVATQKPSSPLLPQSLHHFQTTVSDSEIFQFRSSEISQK